MSNQLVLAPELSGLPASLKEWATGLLGLADAAGGGIQGGGHPRLSIKGRQFTAITMDGDEVRVGNFSQQVGVFVDAIVVGANPAISKIYYDKPFDPSTTEPVSPTCFSDNGIGPSSRAETPQCATCAACPHNAWGSKVTPGGAAIKACADAKKLAVILTEDIQGPVYELRVPAASMKAFGAVNNDLKGRGVPLPMVVLSLSFDQQATYPKLAFKATRYVDAKTELPVVQETLRDKGEEIAEAVGTKDVPAQTATAAPSNVVSLQQAPAHVQQAAAQRAAPASQPQAEAPKRTRRSAAQVAADNAAQAAAQQGAVGGGLGSFGGLGAAPAPQAAQQAQGGFDDAPGAAGTAVPSDAALDGILSGIDFG
jgi:hypothetical protein